jgi:hypothetical protein
VSSDAMCSLWHTDIHGPLTRTRPRHEPTKLSMPQQTIHATNPIHRSGSAGGPGRRPGERPRPDARRTSSSGEGNMFRKHICQFLCPHKLMQIRDERPKHIATPYTDRVPHVHGPEPNRRSSPYRSDP